MLTMIEESSAIYDDYSAVTCRPIDEPQPLNVSAYTAYLSVSWLMTREYAPSLRREYPTHPPPIPISIRSPWHCGFC
jgi:hypothetical protein